MAYTFITDAKKLSAHIKGIEKAARSMVGDIHLAAMSAALQVIDHGNTTAANDLCNAVVNVTHNNSVRRWFNEYCQLLKWDSKAKAFILKKEVRKAILDENGKVVPEARAFAIEALEEAKTYVEFTPVPPFKPTNTLAMLKSAILRGQRAKEEDDERNKLDGLPEMQALYEKLTGEKLAA